MSLDPIVFNKEGLELEEANIVFPVAFPVPPTHDPAGESSDGKSTRHRGPPRSPPKKPNESKHKLYQVPLSDDAIENWTLRELLDAVLQLECEFALFGCQPWSIKDKKALASWYRKMQLRLHPDKVALLKDAQLLADATVAQRKIMKAYETVSGCL